jgi:hypothetical protein
MTEDGAARVMKAIAEWLLETFGIELSEAQRAKLFALIFENSQAQVADVDSEIAT